MHSRFTMKVNSKDSFEYTVDSGDCESSLQPLMSGKQGRVTMAAKPAMSKPVSQ
jgi:hypothetical protein